MTDLPELTCFRVDLDDHVAHVRMSRPDRANSMIPAFWRELPLIVEQLAAQARARVIVLSGEGRHFCSGMDTTVFTAPGGPGSEQRPDREHSPARSAEGFRSTAMRLPKLISPGIAAELAYTGRRMQAARAREVGLVNDVYPDVVTMLAAVHELAAEIAAKSPLAVWSTKRSIAYAREHATADGLEQIAVWNAAMLDPADMTEAFAALRDQRRPSYADLPADPAD